MKSTRPVNLDISTISLPLAAKVSILHRVSGVALLAGVGVLMYLLDVSLSSAEGFERARALLGSTPARLALFLSLAALCWHLAAGVKHLLMDLGIGETREGGALAAKITAATAVILIILSGLWIW